MSEQSASDRAALDGMKVPYHIGIIMDGNGRWAKERGLPRAMGHREGAEALKQVMEAAADFGVKELTIYAFSTENWSRPPQEVKHLMMLLDYFLERELRRFDEQGVQLRHIGRREGVEPKRLARIQEAVALTANNDRLILNVAFNYGGRAEIVDAIRAICKAGLSPDEIDEETISEHLYTYRSPDPELIVRTSGEFRLSNFLIWQASYAEVYITDVYWPDFGREGLLKAILAYNERERRYGGVTVES
ncbi:MAG: isoprenyl transferase [Anaerolineales bacterium]|nr:isoprenyl transferase [Anaerolineales bacterium]MCB9128346.1 isoprenyl transferase [Ardenticatenales bacterium]MCB9172158.1 isoprenyl transferase [Ardenticatenales bacterium]